MNTVNSQETATEMEPYLDSIKLGLYPPGLKILSSHTSDQSAGSVAIANHIDQDYPWTGSAEDAKTYLWNLWFVILNIVRYIPVDHPMQDVLVGALKNLRQRRHDGQDKIHTFVRLLLLTEEALNYSSALINPVSV